jgi:hypothetical protein
VEVDDDMLAFYSNEDTFAIDIKQSPEGDSIEIYLTELNVDHHRLDSTAMMHNGGEV